MKKKSPSPCRDGWDTEDELLYDMTGLTPVPPKSASGRAGKAADAAPATEPNVSDVAFGSAVVAATAESAAGPSRMPPSAAAKKSGAREPPAKLPRQESRPRADDPVQWRLQPANMTNCGKILAHCMEGMETVLGLHRNLVVFKIGATTDPMHRWHQPEWGYHRDADFERLRVLGETRTAEGVCYLESALIALFRDRPGCRNTALGGDGIAAHSAHVGPFFVYVVYRLLPKPP